MNRIKTVRYKQVARRLRADFSTALGTKDTLESLIVKVELRDGSKGFGEAPTSHSRKDETIDSMTGFLKDLVPGLTGMPIYEYENTIENIRREHPSYPMITAAIETALFRANLNTLCYREHDYWGGNKEILETDITVPLLPPDRIVSWMRYFVKRGFTVYKIKLNGVFGEDIPRIDLIYSLLSDSLDDFAVRIDGNQSFTHESFLRTVEYMEKMGHKIQLFEQPFPKSDLEGSRRIRQLVQCPVFLDEAVVTVADLANAIDQGACDGVNIKVAKSGIMGSLEIYRIAKKHGLKLMIGCMMETMTGLSTAIFLASGLGGFDYIDLDSIFFQRYQRRYGDILIDGPRFTIGKGHSEECDL